MENIYKRTADEGIYLKERRYDSPKESFKQIAELLNIAKAGSGKRLVDIGCATGEFLYYVRSLNKEIQLNGIDYSQDLVTDGAPFLSTFGIALQQGDANLLKGVEDKTFDYVTTIGTTSIFDDFRPSFNEMIRIAKAGATCLNHMLVNELDIDVLIKYVNPATSKQESGWNKFSIKSIRTFLEEHPRVGNIKFIKHTLPFDIDKKEDLMRSWTRDVNGERVFWNGLNMEISLYHIVFDIVK